MNQFNEYINTETGECFEGIALTKDEYLKEFNRSKHSNSKTSEIMNEKMLFHNYFGSFYFNDFVDLVQKINNDYATAFRFSYLCTYADYDNVLMIRKTPMKESDFSRVFDMNFSMVTKLKKSLFDNELIIRDSDVLRVNPEFYQRGNISEEFSRKSIRSFDSGIRTLYNSSDIREHKRLGVIIPLLNYTNVYNNILCRNPNEECITKAIPLSKEDIVRATNYNLRYGQTLLDTLLQAKVGDSYLLMFFEVGDVKGFVVNPRIFYRGTDVEHLAPIADLFDLAKLENHNI